MSFPLTRSFIFAAAIAMVPLIASFASAEPWEPGRGAGVSITINKQPSYLNTRTTPDGPPSAAKYDTSAVYQPTYQARNSISFSRSPLPSSLDLPGY